MIVLPPDGQVLYWDDWQVVASLLRDAEVQSIDLVEVFALSHGRQARPAFRVLPAPLSLHAIMADARKAADGLRKRGRSFEIERLPAMQLNFGRYSLMLTLRDPLDYARFMRSAAEVEGNVIRVASFTPPDPFIDALSFRELSPMLSSRLLPGQMFFGCMGLAISQAGWSEWCPEGCVRWFSTTLLGQMRWLETGSLLVSTDFAMPFVRQAQRDLHRIRSVWAAHWS